MQARLRVMVVEGGACVFALGVRLRGVDAAARMLTGHREVIREAVGVPRKTFVTILLLMLLFTPWWAIGKGGRLWGLPGWVVYVGAGFVIFPAVVCMLMHRRWEALADNRDEEEESDQ